MIDVQDATSTSLHDDDNQRRHRRTSYIFVCGPISREGGISSVVSMATKYLSERNTVCATLVFGEIPINKLHPNVEAFNVQTTGFWATCRRLSKHIPETHDVIFVSFDPTTSAYAFLVSTYFRVLRSHASVTHLINVLHPREFFPEFENRRTHRINGLLGGAMGPERFVYMNEPVQQEHETFFKWKPANPAILAVPMETRSPKWEPRSGSTGSISVCSVGRIVAFKSYNFEAVKVTKKLAISGVEVSWDIFGYGEDEARLMKLLEEQGPPRVQLKGEIPISHFDTTVSDYDVFVGMGLSALHAAHLGVPTILAVESAGSESYGWIDNVPHGIVGENIAGIEKKQISEVLRSFCKMTRSEKTELSSRNVAYASKYSVESYVDGLKLFSSIDPKQRCFAPILASVAFLLANSTTVRKAARLLKFNKRGTLR